MLMNKLMQWMVCGLFAAGNWASAQVLGNLDGASGKVFKIDMNSKTFELLKETEYAPTSDIGQSRFTVHWTDGTRITSVDELGKAPKSDKPVLKQFYDLKRGFWQAQLSGKQEGDKFVVKEMEVSPLPDPRETDDPKLSRVLVIGDSISMNYHDAAKNALAGIANYHRNEGNSISTAHGVRNAELWLGNYQERGFHWDVIQFNHGLHDLKQVYDKNKNEWGAYSVSLDDYKANLEKEIKILKQSGAKLIWCSTTPVPNDNKGKYGRAKGSSKIFNDAAMEVMKKHPEIIINDLHQAISDSPVFDSWRKQNDVHFYKKDERKVIGEAVANAVKKALNELKQDA